MRQDQVTGAINRHVKKFSQDRPAFMKEGPWKRLDLAWFK